LTTHQNELFFLIRRFIIIIRAETDIIFFSFYLKFLRTYFEYLNELPERHATNTDKNSVFFDLTRKTAKDKASAIN